jgi:hypothetical protein
MSFNPTISSTNGSPSPSFSSQVPNQLAPMSQSPTNWSANPLGSVYPNPSLTQAQLGNLPPVTVYRPTSPTLNSAGTTAEPEPEPNASFTNDPWLQQRLNYIASIAPPPSPSSSSGGVS